MKKYTIEEFTDQIRSKYPNSYDDLDDEKLIELWLKKFPNDEEKIIFESKENDNLNAPQKNNNRYWWGAAALILLIILRVAITSGTLKDSDFVNGNHLKYDNDKIKLNYGIVTNESFDELYIFENPQVLESDGEPADEINITNPGIYLELCHWTKNTKSLNIENEDLLMDLPLGQYSFNKNNLGNWNPFTITDMYFSTPNFSSDSSPVKIISGTMNISKNQEEYTIDFQFELNNGKGMSGLFTGPLSKFN